MVITGKSQCCKRNDALHRAASHNAAFDLFSSSKRFYSLHIISERSQYGELNPGKDAENMTTRQSFQDSATQKSRKRRNILRDSEFF